MAVTLTSSNTIPKEMGVIRKIKLIRRNPGDLGLFKAKSPGGSDISATTESTELVDDRIVRFIDKVAVFKVPGKSDLSMQEINSCWWNEEEMSKIAESCLSQAIKMDQGVALKDKKYCSRGLETLTKLGNISKTQNRFSSIDIVLDKQDQQRRQGIKDEIAIAESYRDSSASCQLWSQTIALRDQREAEDYFDIT
jgi:hypothetical protein